jgi:hypothetical protein
MPAKITFFPVGNGDMTLIKLNDDSSGPTTILIDVNIREAADDDNDVDIPDVAKELRKRLNEDSDKRPYVDVFLLSHPDKDHCTGLSRHFHLDDLENYDDEPANDEEKKIVIREMWSSPVVFRRASKNNSLCDDAKVFNKEAKRRVKVFRETEEGVVKDGDKIKILGEDENGKTDDLSEILIKQGKCFTDIRGKENEHIEMCLIAPLPKDGEEEEEKTLAKNHSSVVIRFSIAADKNTPDACSFLTGGDAEVAIWERIWDKYKDNRETLEYDILQAPHHCSWHVLSYESWNDSESPEVSKDAKAALSQAREGAFIVASSKPIKDDGNDPPCIGAKNEYISILDITDSFYCTGEWPNSKNPEPLEFSLTTSGPQAPAKKKSANIAAAGLASTSRPFEHG